MNCTMLVLTRKLMEKVYIGSDICVTVVRLEGGQVRLGIDAPRDIPIARAELLRKHVEPPSFAEALAEAVGPLPTPARIDASADEDLGAEVRVQSGGDGRSVSSPSGPPAG
jgi:carbon storage regulator